VIGQKIGTPGHLADRGVEEHVPVATISASAVPRRAVLAPRPGLRFPKLRNICIQRGVK
jgi:hypothetical protein